MIMCSRYLYMLLRFVPDVVLRTDNVLKESSETSTIVIPNMYFKMNQIISSNKRFKGIRVKTETRQKVGCY